MLLKELFVSFEVQPWPRRIPRRELFASLQSSTSVEEDIWERAARESSKFDLGWGGYLGGNYSWVFEVWPQPRRILGRELFVSLQSSTSIEEGTNLRASKFDLCQGVYWWNPKSSTIAKWEHLGGTTDEISTLVEWEHSVRNWWNPKSSKTETISWQGNPLKLLAIVDVEDIRLR